MQLDITLVGLGMAIPARTVSGWPSVTAAVSVITIMLYLTSPTIKRFDVQTLKALSGKPDATQPEFGLAYDHFGGGAAGTLD
jgi:hypothetical protein